MSYARRSKTDPLFTFDRHKMCNEKLQTEIRENYVPPKKKKPTVTREAKFEEFLWHELYDEYIRSMNSRIGTDSRPSTSEYYDQYSRIRLDQSKSNMEELMKQYPLYESQAVTHWNPNLSRPSSFGCSRSFSKPIGEQLDIQFG